MTKENPNTDVLKALCNLDKIRNNNIEQLYLWYNKINNRGTGLEYYIKDLFCNSNHIKDINKKEKQYQNYLSYLWNQNNPPDFIIKDSSAIEVKKIRTKGSSIALNSSYPKNKLYSEDTRIQKACKNCEAYNWKQKDMIYIIGVEKAWKISLLWFIDWDCYSANKEVYLKLSNTITESIAKSHFKLSKTNELGRVNEVDPLGITKLRVRGMWQIDNPIKVYDYLNLDFNKDNDLTVYSILTKRKFDSYSEDSKKGIEKSNFKIEDVKIKNPNNPANNIKAKFIKNSYTSL